MLFSEFLKESLYLSANGNKAIYDPRKSSDDKSINMYYKSKNLVNNFSYRTIDGIKVYSLYKADNDDRIEIVRKLKSQNGDSEFTRDSANILFNALKEYDGKISKNIIVVMPHSSSDLIRDWAKKTIRNF